MFEMRYNCPDCKRPGRSGFGGALPMLIINGIIIGVVLMWCLAIKIWSPKQDSILIENLNHDQKIADEVAARAAEAEGAEVPDDDDMPEFDAEEFYAKFDDENLPIDIPDEVEDDVDNDFNIEIKDKPEPTDE